MVAGAPMLPEHELEAALQQAESKLRHDQAAGLCAIDTPVRPLGSGASERNTIGTRHSPLANRHSPLAARRPQICFRGTCNATADTGKKYTAYAIEVSLLGQSWRVEASSPPSFSPLTCTLHSSGSCLARRSTVRAPPCAAQPTLLSRNSARFLRADRGGPDPCTQKRYSEFDDLRCALEDKYIHIQGAVEAKAWPNFPEKRILGNFEPNLIQSRTFALEAFMMSLLHLPTVAADPMLLDFLGAPVEPSQKEVDAGRRRFFARVATWHHSSGAPSAAASAPPEVLAEWGWGHGLENISDVRLLCRVDSVDSVRTVTCSRTVTVHEFVY